MKLKNHKSKFNHIGLVNKNKSEALLFYKDLLGCELLYEFDIEPEISYRIFKYDDKIHVLMFGMDNIKIEIFLIEKPDLQIPPIPHFCFELNYIEEFIAKANQLNIEIIEIINSKGKINYNIRDLSGNLFEIKEFEE